VFVRFLADELAEGTSPRRVGIAADGLCEHARPYGTVVEMITVLGGDFEQCSAADDDGQQTRARDGDEQPARIQDEPFFAAGELRIGDGRRDSDDISCFTVSIFSSFQITVISSSSRSIRSQSVIVETCPSYPNELIAVSIDS
jgi:hypothetical protein